MGDVAATWAPWHTIVMPKDDPATVQTAIRVPADWMPRLQAIAGRLSRPGLALTTSDALRACLAEGMAKLEAELGITQPGKAKR